MRMITKEEFEKLSPYDRGYVTYMCGCRDDQPHVPDEQNPYPAGSVDAADWDVGQPRACLAAQDSEE